jgi:hypothetical protein
MYLFIYLFITVVTFISQEAFFVQFIPFSMLGGPIENDSHNSEKGLLKRN